MEPSLTWLDFSSADREKMRRVLDLFKEQGTVDEMGLGTLRDALADALFPGTSTIQTRLRYMLFVPWLYQRLERRCGQMGDLGRAARDAEIELIGPLASGDDAEGVIGSRARVGLSRLPSQVYWAGLVRWGDLPVSPEPELVSQPFHRPLPAGSGRYSCRRPGFGVGESWDVASTPAVCAGGFPVGGLIFIAQGGRGVSARAH